MLARERLYHLRNTGSVKYAWGFSGFGLIKYSSRIRQKNCVRTFGSTGPMLEVVLVAKHLIRNLVCR
jgi:hypothetical protein